MAAPKRPSPRREAGRAPLTDLLRAAIDARRASASAVAAASGVDRRVVGRWLAGGKTITLATADRIASALGLRPTDSAGRKSPRPLPEPAPVPPAPGLPTAPDAGCEVPAPGGGDGD